jgi:hypothetical protein
VQNPCRLVNTDRLTEYRQLLDVRQLQPSGAVAWPVRREFAAADQVPDPLPVILRITPASAVVIRGSRHPRLAEHSLADWQVSYVVRCHAPEA